TEELAKDLARQIEAKKDHRDAEYVAVVYRSGGELKMTQLHTIGSAFSAPLQKAIDEAGGADNVLAVVHNHTQKNAEKSFDKSATLKHDELPSSRPHDKSLPADWDAAQARFGDRTDVAYYLLDPNDKLRRYDYADREVWIREVQPPTRFEAMRGGKSLHPAPELDMKPSPAQAESPTPPAADTAPALSDPRALRLQTQARDAIAGMQTGLAVGENGNSERAAACVGRLAYQQGFDEIVSVAPNQATAAHAAGDLLCVQGRSSNPDPYLNRAVIPTAEALATPVEESLRRTQALQGQTQQPGAAEPSQQATLSR
ncbi:MAG: XVIPCD domain-containing protein, partial [Lysobacter sp.]